jgi:lipoate-protein ligase A
LSLPVFGFVCRHLEPLADGIASERAWLERAAQSGRASAHLWHARPGFVVPRSYERLPGFAAACEASAHGGWPVRVRPSGGGLVPQGPGVLNFSLAWRVEAGAPAATDAVYRALCDGLAAAFARLGLATDTRAVEGSFCDGRFNLAFGGAKLVGTAQAWKRFDGVPTALAHAVMLVDADPDALTARCNGFEAALGHDRRYRADAITSVARAWSAAHGAAPPVSLSERVATAIAERFARVVPPAVAAP